MSAITLRLESRGERQPIEPTTPPPNLIDISDAARVHRVAYPTATLGPILHTCSVCGACSTWGDGWRLWGSVADQENGMPLLKFCGPACADRVPAVRFAEITKTAVCKAGTTEAQIKRHGYLGPRVVEIEVEL